MDIFLYFTERLPCGLDELEDAIESALGDFGEVTGVGTGELGSNIDITIDNQDISKDAAIQLVRSAIAQFDLPSTSQMVIDEEEMRIV
jgi:hypothetical protein